MKKLLIVSLLIFGIGCQKKPVDPSSLPPRKPGTTWVDKKDGTIWTRTQNGDRVGFPKETKLQEVCPPGTGRNFYGGCSVGGVCRINWPPENIQKPAEPCTNENQPYPGPQLGCPNFITDARW